KRPGMERTPHPCRVERTANVLPARDIVDEEHIIVARARNAFCKCTAWRGEHDHRRSDPGLAIVRRAPIPDGIAARPLLREGTNLAGCRIIRDRASAILEDVVESAAECGPAGPLGASSWIGDALVLE